MSVRRKLVRDTANALLQQHGVSSPPVDVVRVARRLGAQIAKAPAGDPELSGFLLRQPGSGSVIIGVNAKHPATRQRFTVAHEIGHLLLHKGQEFHVDRGAFRVQMRNQESATGTNIAEIEANLFAAELLMPVSMMESALAEALWVDLADEHSLRRLASRFGVSPQAMAFRLVNLGLLNL